MTDALNAARKAMERREWNVARDNLLAARDRGPLSADDVTLLGEAAWWLGLVDEALSCADESYRLFLEEDKPKRAAMAAMDAAIVLFLRGEEAPGAGWVSRAQRLLADEPDCVEQGYLLYADVEGSLEGADHEATIAKARQVQDIGRRYDDANLVAAGTVAEGRALVKAGRPKEGFTLLDEGMLAATSDRLNPGWAGNIYCHLMSACHELSDIRRAGAWTQATTEWCEQLSAAVLFAGICRVHRAQVLQIRGDWDTSEDEAARVCADLAHMHLGTVAEGHYQVAEIRRLRGDLSGAEESYQAGHRLGRDPQPGLALLRLAQDRTDEASVSIASALDAVPDDRLKRARLLAAQVEIALAAGDISTARTATDELEDIASTYGSSGLEAASRTARGAVTLSEGRPRDALPVLRDACQRWHDVDAPYDTAKVRLLLARTYRAMGDEGAATLEIDAAEEVFDRLGAVVEQGEVDALRGMPVLPGGLSQREVEVLRLVAEGKTNRAVAEALVISEKTVARHLSNIFTKLGVSSRTAAAAFAHEHRLTRG